ncbi:MAG: glycosyltransferase family 2 protein [Chitinophagales bacterium]
MPVKYSIISINYNQKLLTYALLQSIAKYPPDDSYEIIIVDNASREEEIPYPLPHLPLYSLIKNEKNAGFAGGNNIGIRAAKGNYLFLVNNDTEFTQDLCKILSQTLASQTDIGIICPKINYFAPPDTIQFVGFTPISTLTARNRTIGVGEKDTEQYTGILSTAYAHGAAMMLPHEIIDKVGLMPEIYFLYYEEMDWSEQIKNKGFSIKVQTDALIYHKESASMGGNSPLKTYYLYRNRLLFVRRNRSTAQILLFCIYYFCIALPKAVFSFLLQGKFSHIKAIFAALLWHLSPKKILD